MGVPSLSKSCLGTLSCSMFMNVSDIVIAVHCSLHAASTVEQVFPLSAEYSCHSPSTKLKCTFSANARSAEWVVCNDRLKVSEQVTASTPGHIVDVSEFEVKNGTIFLQVNNTMYSKNNSYSCTVLYLDGNTSVSDFYSIPMVEGQQNLMHDDYYIVYVSMRKIICIKMYFCIFTQMLPHLLKTWPLSQCGTHYTSSGNINIICVAISLSIWMILPFLNVQISQHWIVPSGTLMLESSMRWK